MEHSAATKRLLTSGLPLWRWLVVGAFTTAIASADGMIIGLDPRLGHWSLQEEQSQLCLINYEKGIERMLISVAISDLRGARAAWIVPIPSAPDGTTVDIVKGFPTLEGSDVIYQAGRALDRQFRWISLTQLYPALLLHAPDQEYDLGPVYGDRGEVGDEVNVHSHEEKMGLTAELVSARHPGAIFGYLKEKGVELPNEVRLMLETYPADSFSFVVTWISDSSSFMRESLTTRERSELTPAIGISVSFPTRRAYFPLRPTSVYGQVSVPIDVYAIGHAAPVFRRRHYTSYYGYWVSYLSQTNYQVPEALRGFFNGRSHIKRLDFTHIDISAESWTLGWDLWFRAGPPVSVTCARVLRDYPFVWMPFIFLLCSCVASIISGAIVLRRFRLPLLHQAGLGLWNCTTLLGFAVATAFARFPAAASPDSLSPATRRRGAGVVRRLLFIIVFTAVFQALLILFYLAVKAALGPS